MDLYDFVNHATLGSPNTDYRGKSGSSSWGWTDPDSGREFIGKRPDALPGTCTVP